MSRTYVHKPKDIYLLNHYEIHKFLNRKYKVKEDQIYTNRKLRYSKIDEEDIDLYKAIKEYKKLSELIKG